MTNTLGDLFVTYFLALVMSLIFTTPLAQIFHRLVNRLLNNPANNSLFGKANNEEKKCDIVLNSFVDIKNTDKIEQCQQVENNNEKI